ncbi:hypothetical protein [Streptomyces pharetrae]|uniref:hypothetical protein n=1 Tax=Streptomyces pharetrae TaxID=291370 RepID=UPI00384D54F2
MEREGNRPVPRGAVVEVAGNGEGELVPVRLGVWLSNTRARRNKLHRRTTRRPAGTGH